MARLRHTRLKVSHVTNTIYDTELRNGATGVELTRLSAASKLESGAWLHALPSSHLGTLLDDDSLRVAAGLRLGCAVCSVHLRGYAGSKWSARPQLHPVRRPETTPLMS